MEIDVTDGGATDIHWKYVHANTAWQSNVSADLATTGEVSSGFQTFKSSIVSAIEMAEAYLKDKKRVIPSAALCEGEFGVDGYFIGVPTVIGAGGIEKILEFKLLPEEQEMLNKTLIAVKKTVACWV